MKKLFFYILALGAMASCETANENVEPQNNVGSREIQLKTSVLQMDVASKAALTGESFDNNTAIGLYGIQQGKDWTTTPYFNNTGATIVDNAVTFPEGVHVYYPQDNTSVSFYAYYPKEATASDLDAERHVVTYALAENDILWATVNAGTISSQSTDALKFSHKLAKINFKAKVASGFSDVITIASIILTNANTQAELDIATGTLTYSTSTNLEAYSGGAAISTLSGAFGELLLEPEATCNLSVVAGGITYDASLKTPKAGQAQTITLTFQPTGITTQTSITEWDQIADGNIDIKK